MHTSLNKCELLAEQIVTGVTYGKAKFNPNDFKISNGIRNEYKWLQEFYKLMREDNDCGDDTIFYLRDFIAYILWYEVNVVNKPYEAFEYAKQVVYSKWKVEWRS